MIAVLAAAILASATAMPEAPVPDYGIAEGMCRPHEKGPALLVTAAGLKDRTGKLRVELYAPNDAEFLADDRDLVRDGKVFRRTVIDVPAAGAVELCVRAPHTGTWSVALIHDRAGAKKFRLSSDGIGFGGNPHLGLSKPHAEVSEIDVGPGVTRSAIRLNYRHGLFSFGPIEDAK
jgi:uncharacterized protein (DUF2141 family)